MRNNETSSTILSDLQQALHYLYDPVQLRKNSFVHRFQLAQQVDPSAALRRILIEAIGALAPDEEVPSHSNVSRYYTLLYHRYVEQFTQQEVAADMGLGVRQLRRLEKQALSVLAEYLWTDNVVDAEEPASRSGIPVDLRDSSGETATPSREEELAWSQKTIPTQTVEVADLIASTLQIAGPLVHSLGLDVEQDIPEHLPRLDVQVVAIRQALLNLLTTVARQAPGERILIKAETQDETVLVQLMVETRGNGQFVLERGNKGSLSMAEELVELSGGRLEIVANGAGQDRQRIQLTLPTEQQVTVLAIDDNPDTLLLLQRYSAGTCYKLIGVHDPHQFVALAEELFPQIMVVDIMLPDIDGWELLGRLRAHPNLGTIPIIIATILPQEQLASALGAAAFIRKPIRRSAFLNALDTQLSMLRR